ncbi:peptide chain release factor N(5)-glutamine methyltransferase [Mucilaginibacter daejeonensis]|uniref:peptide chain release factor N(5)-glutamine methyltransferase n=1 Tax=Mucilaginibacter daejeonensis TaxID=398049 RepID=UPI001D17646D|nr:peptide chain release factor N(5)-glutamine methyltransferase [Mucilaginibacter daejeonensis]UEG55302.1 peptide chain release factor N(5)-glutamine methyltransferase [Mucilaginibacter daejeonensis]
MSGHGTKVGFMFLCWMITVKDAYHTFKTRLEPLYAAQEIEALTSLVLVELTGRSRAQLKAFGDSKLTHDQVERLTNVLDQLLTGMPVQYVLGYTEFYGHTFKVTPAVLIPRPETEELVEWVAQTIGHQQGLKLMDIGTGSGCIPISLKLTNTENELYAVDISSEALDIAKENAVSNQADITFVETDILKPLPAQIAVERFNVIISNPPYVTGADKRQMHKNVTDFEPHMALFVPDDDPLLFYVRIADVAQKLLVDGGYLFFEINESFGQETSTMLASKGFKNIELRQDMSGRDRMIRCVR